MRAVKIALRANVKLIREGESYVLSVLLIEDDRDLAASLIDHLELKHMICDHAANGTEGLKLISENHYEVVILDLNMAGIDGLSVCRWMRQRGDNTPVLMLTARDTLENKIEGFEVGADDYQVKPFEVEELIARLRVLSKRRSGQVTRLEVGPISLDLNHRSAWLDNQPIKLTPTAFVVLEALLRASPNPLSQIDLTRKIWGDEITNSNKLRVHVHNLRKVLRAGEAEHLLKTIPGYGFCIVSQTT